jgi:hypothetical protein
MEQLVLEVVQLEMLVETGCKQILILHVLVVRVELILAVEEEEWVLAFLLVEMEVPVL